MAFGSKPPVNAKSAWAAAGLYNDSKAGAAHRSSAEEISPLLQQIPLFSQAAAILLSSRKTRSPRFFLPPPGMPRLPKSNPMPQE
jgi:hypothetical protein